MKDRGIDALINDSLVGAGELTCKSRARARQLIRAVLMWGSYLNGFLCALFGYLYLRCECPSTLETEHEAHHLSPSVTDPAYNASGSYSA